MAMKIVEVNDMSEGFIEGGTRLLSDHDGMSISTHETLEEIEAGEATNRDGADHTLVVHRDDLARELRMDARATFAWKLVRLGELTSSASSLAKSSIDISGRDVWRHALPCRVLYSLYHGASTWMTQTLVEPEDLADLVRGNTFAALASQTCAIRSDIRDNAIEPLRILTVKGHG
jgi:hypothetical protein